MGRLEALVVSALGRSPYDEKVVWSEVPSIVNGVIVAGQGYDERAHPVNIETGLRMRDHVRASNEVMQAAGIIEETSTARNREISREKTLHDETETVLGRLEQGRVLLVAGCYGVVGLRRRILLYGNYSNYSVLDIIRTERSRYSIPHLLYFGMPGLILCHAIDFTIRTAVDLSNVSTVPSIGTVLEVDSWKSVRRLVYPTLDVAFRYIWMHCHTFAVLQQINLVSSDRILPTFRWFIPFSRESPLQLPPLPNSLAPVPIISWLVTLTAATAPMALVYFYGFAVGNICGIVNRPLYRLLPRALPEIMTTSHSDRALVDNRAERVGYPITSNDTNILPEDIIDFEPETPFGPEPDFPAPAPPTLQPHESPTSAPVLDDDSSFDGEDHQVTSQTLITFDVEATDPTTAHGSLGIWSAELRSANEPPPEPTQSYFNLTARAMLPPLLAADALSAVISGVIMIPLETIMVRVVARMYRVNAGLGTADLLSVAEILRPVPWQRAVNLLAVEGLRCVVVGVLWGVVVMGYEALSKARKKVDTSGEDLEITARLGAID